MRKICIVSILLVCSITSCSFNYVPTGSMEETFHVGDHILSSIFFGTLQRGDIVLFESPADPGKDYIKRVIALPGDQFNIKNDFVFINGVKLDEPYTFGKPTDYEHFNITKSNNIEGVVPAGKIVVIGDNRVNSSDSRYFGYVDMSAVKSKVKYIYWNTEDVVNGKYSRLGMVR